MDIVECILLYKHREAEGFRGRIYYEWKMMKRLVPRINMIGTRFRLYALDNCVVRVGANFNGYHFNDPNPLANDIFGGNSFHGDCVVMFPPEVTDEEREAAYQEMRQALTEVGWEQSTFVVENIRCVSPVMILDLT